MLYGIPAIGKYKSLIQTAAPTRFIVKGLSSIFYGQVKSQLCVWGVSYKPCFVYTGEGIHLSSNHNLNLLSSFLRDIYFKSSPLNLHSSIHSVRRRHPITLFPDF